MIKELLNEYKEITIRIIKKINNDKETISLMEKREKIIKKLFSKENNKEEIKKEYLNMNLLELDEKLKDIINKQKDNVKEEIKNLHKAKNANNAYGKNKNINSFFSAKI